MSLATKARLAAWGAIEAVRLGRPKASIGFFGGIGDDLLCTTAVHELHLRGSGRLWFFTRFPKLYSPEAGVSLVPEDGRYLKLAERLGAPMRSLSYSPYDPATDRDLPTSEHIIAAMCRLAGVRGRVSLRPYLALHESEREKAAAYQGSVVIQTSSMTAAAPMKNKQWDPDRFQKVADSLAGSAKVVQLGSPNDPPLRGTTDLRGKTSLRESAAILSQARLFVGLSGFLKHLARAVECPAVIVYGGRELPAITGYVCNINIATAPPCAPCWQRSACSFGHVCMTSITAEQVISAVQSALAQRPSTLSVEEATIA